MSSKTALILLSLVSVLSVIIGYNFIYHPEITIAIASSSALVDRNNIDVDVPRKYQECLKNIKDEFERHKNESILNSTVWNGIKHVIFFLGHGRSGTTLVGSLLDAHPNIIVANEYNAIEKWRRLKKDTQNRDYFFQALYSNSFEHARIGSRRKDCSTKEHPLTKHVPNQWQGRFDKHIQLIGDKKAEMFIRRIVMAQPTEGNSNTLSSIQEAVKVPFKFIYILRNPFDIAATKMYRKTSLGTKESERHKLYDNPLKYKKPLQLEVVKFLVKVIKAAANYTQHLGDQVIMVYSEDLIDNPTKQLKRLCKFLEVPCSEDYFKDCSTIVFKSPSKTRNTIVWDEEAKNMINTLIQEVPLFKRYNFDD